MLLEPGNEKYYESLIGMLDEEGNIVLPGAFLTVAECFNLIQNIDFWVINKAFSLLVKNPTFIASINFLSINPPGLILTGDETNHAMVKSINDFSQVMGIKTIVEFVEDEQTRNILKTLGVNYVQGFGLGNPWNFDGVLNQIQY